MPNTCFLTDPVSLDALREALERSAAGLAEHRADMIESLGDHLCGSGPGPQPADAERLAWLEENYQTLRCAYENARRCAAPDNQAWTGNRKK